MIQRLLQKGLRSKGSPLSFKGFAMAAFTLAGLAASQQSKAQYNISHYTFSSDVTGSLETDFSGCDTAINVATANIGSANKNIGFTFYFMGVAYTNLGINNNGQFRLFTDATSTLPGTALTSYSATLNTFAPMTNTNRSTSVVTKVFGTAPNRKLVIQWNQFNINTTAHTSPGNMQAWLEESTGKITYVYGEIYNSGAATSRSVFLSNNNTTGQSGFVTIAAPPTFTPSTSATTSSIAIGGASTTTLVANLGSSSNTTRRYYSFTPAASLPAVSGINFTNVGTSSMILNWTDNATNEAGYRIEYSTDNVNWTTATTTNTDVVTANISQLNSATLYYWRITTLNENGAQLNSATATQATLACGSITGIVTVGATGVDTSLYQALNQLALTGLTGSVVLELQPDYNLNSETFPITAPNVGCLGTSNTITIRPAATVVSPINLSSNTAQIININGGRGYIIDGRPGGAGTTSMLTIENTTTSGSCIQFINGATNNNILYCKITGAVTSNATGLVKFSTSTGISGNNENVISNCNFTANASGTLAACIVSTGSTGFPNINNSITSNNFSNFFNGSSSSYGINITNSGNSNWTIYGNSFYQNIANPTGSVITAINIGIGDSTVIRSNFIGGNAPMAQGTWLSNAATTSNTQRFVGIQNNGGDNIPTLVDSNVITGFNFNSTNTSTTGAGVLSAIYVADGNANIGVIDGNLIGSMTTTDAIKVAATFNSVNNTNLGLCLNGVFLNTTATSNVVIANNKIGGLTAVGISTSNNGKVFGIVNLLATMTAINNTIGGNVANSLRCGNSAAANGIGEIYGIKDNAAKATMISGNTIQNISQMGNGATVSPAMGIHITGTNTVATMDTIMNNTVSNILNSSSESVTGIKFESTNSFIYGNNIHDLVYANVSSNNIGISGIATTGTSTLAYNTVQRILHSGADVTSGNIYGIHVNSLGNANLYNNTIFMDNGSGGPITSGNVTVGLRMATTSNNIYNNLIVLKSNTTSSACLWNNQPNTTSAPTPTKLQANRNIYNINKMTRNFLFVQGDITTNKLVGFYNCDTCVPLAGVVDSYSVVYDVNFNTDCSLYKNYMKISGGRENATFNEDVSLVGSGVYPANLQPNPTGFTYALNRGIPQGYTTDILGNAVSSSTPDIGAIEFSSGNTDMNAGSPLINNSGAANTTTADATAGVKLYNADCELIAQVMPSGAAQVAGNVTAQAWLDNGAGNYAKRHTQITPVNNASTATATVTLYYTPQDFMDFNTANPAALPMPTGITDNGNLRIQKLSGTTNDGTGLPNSYPSTTPTTITPTSVTWNADSVYWAVTFDVTGFSGFFLNTDPASTPLPIDFVNFKAIAQSQANQLTWAMGNATLKGSFEVMHSLDGAKFESIGTVISNDRNNYVFNHEAPKAMEVYQIKFTDASGKVYYSMTQMVQRKDKSNLAIMLYPNPMSQNAVLKVNVMNAANANATYVITNILGEEVLKDIIETMGNNDITTQINIGALANGIYNFKLVSGNDQIVRKLVVAGK